jgi:NADH dehydrogenase/NADH:ubiquinone oxidoreductase subunit G
MRGRSGWTNPLGGIVCHPLSREHGGAHQYAESSNSRKQIIEMLLSEHNADCTKCYKNGNCELQELAAEYKIMSQDLIDLVHYKSYTVDMFSPSIIKDDSRCIRCQRCVRTCAELQGVNALSVAYKGDHMKISTFFEKSMNEVVCTNCGQCVNHCPTGALIEKNYIEEVWEAIADPRQAPGCSNSSCRKGWLGRGAWLRSRAPGLPAKWWQR